MKHQTCIPRSWLLFLGMLLTVRAPAQNKADLQLWQDFLLSRVWGRHLVESEFSYQTLLSGKNQWSSYNLTPTYEFSLSKYLDLTFNLPLSYTRQTDTSNTFEIKTVLGARTYLTPWKRIETRINLRWERRFFNNIDSHTWEKSNRMRIRAEVVVPINQPNYYRDNMYYVLADAEAFIVYDQQVQERYSNRLRFRLGFGYRYTYNWRFEIIYALQQSRNVIDGDYTTIDNIIRLRVKCVLPFAKHKTKTESSLGQGAGS